MDDITANELKKLLEDADNAYTAYKGYEVIGDPYEDDNSPCKFKYSYVKSGIEHILKNHFDKTEGR